MNSKQYLEQVLKVEDAMIAKVNEKDWIQEVSTASGAINYENDRTIGSAPTSSRFENALIRKVDLENQIAEEYGRLLRIHTEIRKVILAVEDIDAQNALAQYYLCRKTEDVIAGKFHVSKKTIQRRLDRGYEEVAKLTGYPAPPKQKMPARERHHIARDMMKEVYADEQIH